MNVEKPTITTDRGNRDRKAAIHLNCNICPPHGGENAGRKPKHGTQKPRKRIRRK
jgi:hypothetical protein